MFFKKIWDDKFLKKSFSPYNRYNINITFLNT